MAELLELERLKRKLRKKLRQIENLEVLDRDLNDEELDKVLKRDEIRAQLKQLVKETEARGREEEEMKRPHDDGEVMSSADVSPEKKAFKEPPAAAAVVEGELITHFSETEDVTELHYSGDSLPPALAEGGGAEVELQSASVHVSSTDTEDWELVTKSKVEPSSRVKTESKQSKTTKAAQTPTTEPSTSRSAAPVSQPQPSTSQAKPPAAKKAQAVSRQKPVRDPEVEAVRQGGWLVRELEGHEDLVLDCDLDLGLGLAVTASRDTTVKVGTGQ